MAESVGFWALSLALLNSKRKTRTKSDESMGTKNSSWLRHLGDASSPSSVEHQLESKKKELPRAGSGQQLQEAHYFPTFFLIWLKQQLPIPPCPYCSPQCPHCASPLSTASSPLHPSYCPRLWTGNSGEKTPKYQKMQQPPLIQEDMFRDPQRNPKLQTVPSP